MSDFFSNYEHVNVPKNIGTKIFQMSALELSVFTFFQSKNPSEWIDRININDFGVINAIVSTLKNTFQANYFSDNYDFLIALPYRLNKQIQIDETISIYIIMFYLSDLVRYKPQYLEGLLNSKDKWLIDSFVQSCPTTFLRSIVSRIINVDYTLTRR